MYFEIKYKIDLDVYKQGYFQTIISNDFTFNLKA